MMNIKTDDYAEIFELTKQCLSISATSTLKDNEINMLIKAGIEDLSRLDVDVEKYIDNSLIQAAIVMFVKSNFGNTDIKEKESAKETYSRLCSNISMTTEFKKGDDSNV